MTLAQYGAGARWLDKQQQVIKGLMDQVSLKQSLCCQMCSRGGWITLRGNWTDFPLELYGGVSQEEKPEI